MSRKKLPLNEKVENFIKRNFNKYLIKKIAGSPIQNEVLLIKEKVKKDNSGNIIGWETITINKEKFNYLFNELIEDDTLDDVSTINAMIDKSIINNMGWEDILKNWRSNE